MPNYAYAHLIFRQDKRCVENNPLNVLIAWRSGQAAIVFKVAFKVWNFKYWILTQFPTFCDRFPDQSNQVKGFFSYFSVAGQHHGTPQGLVSVVNSVFYTFQRIHDWVQEMVFAMLVHLREVFTKEIFWQSLFCQKKKKKKKRKSTFLQYQFVWSTTGCFFWLVLPQKILSMELVPPNRKKCSKIDPKMR